MLSIAEPAPRGAAPPRTSGTTAAPNACGLWTKVPLDAAFLLQDFERAAQRTAPHPQLRGERAFRRNAAVLREVSLVDELTYLRKCLIATVH